MNTVVFKIDDRGRIIKEDNHYSGLIGRVYSRNFNHDQLRDINPDYEYIDYTTALMCDDYVNNDYSFIVYFKVK